MLAHNAVATALSHKHHPSPIIHVGAKYSREKCQKCFSVMGELRGQARVRPIDKLDEACTNADDHMMLVQHRSGNCVMN